MKRRFAGLELLRFSAAASVLVWHYQHFFYDVRPGEPVWYVRTAQPAYAVLAPLYEHGNFAVQVFWCISGFIFFHRYGAAIHARRVSLREYLVFRVSRLYPLHAVTLLAVLALQLVFTRVHGTGERFVYQPFDLRHFVLNVLMISQWGFQRGLSFNGPVWSVSVEEFCYLAFFLLASAVAFHRRSLAVLLVAAWVVLTSNVFSSEFGECIALFLVGGVLWAFHAGIVARGTGARLGAVAAALAVGLAAFAYRGAIPGLPPTLRLTLTHLVLVPALMLGFLLLWPDGESRPARLAGELGKLTYAIYMIHFPVQLAAVTAVEALGASRAVFYRGAALPLFLGVVLALASVVYRRFEMPMQSWVRARLLPAPRAPEVAAGGGAIEAA